MPCYHDTMTLSSRLLRAPAVLLSALLALAALPASAHAQNVVELQVEGGIGAATAEYVVSGIRHAEETGAELVIIRMDTPGGLVGAMRDIVTKILNSDVPVATYVSPVGARAASAGTFILLASHVAAMAPTTSVGAATPVSITGDDVAPLSPPEPAPQEPADDRDSGDTGAGDEGETTGEPSSTDAPQPDQTPPTAIGRKVLNDSVEYIRGLADRHGRNADWAERAVVEAVTLSAEEALDENVIDLIAEDRADLLAQIDGREVRVGSQTVTLATASATVEEFEPSWRIKLLSVIQQPEIILLLGLIGIYGLLFEGYNPGAIVPGVVGAICLLLALYAVQVLPINYAGLALILLGIGLMVAEAFAPSFGALGLGGIAAFVFGAIMMFDSDVPGFGISIAFVISLAIFAALFVIWVVGYLLKLRRRGAVYGEEALVGSTGAAMEDFTGDGKIWLDGEAWAARSSTPLAKDEAVRVTAVEGLTLVVEPLPGKETEAHLPT